MDDAVDDVDVTGVESHAVIPLLEEDEDEDEDDEDDDDDDVVLVWC